MVQDIYFNTFLYYNSTVTIICQQYRVDKYIGLDKL